MFIAVCSVLIGRDFSEGWNTAVRFDSDRLVGNTRDRPRLGLGNTSAGERGGNLCLLAHLLRGGRSVSAGELDDLRSGSAIGQVNRVAVARIVACAIGWRTVEWSTGGKWLARWREGTQLNARVCGKRSGDEEGVVRFDRAFLDAQTATWRDAVAREKDTDARSNGSLVGEEV